MVNTEKVVDTIKHKTSNYRLNLDSAVKWLHNGAQPTDTASYSFLHKGFIETSP
jgi:ribosomal protein S16